MINIKVFAKSDRLAHSAAAVFLAFIAASLLLFIFKRNPLEMFRALLQAATGFDARRGTWNSRYISEWIAVSIPVILCALSMGFALRFKLYNLGMEGQFLIGFAAAQFAALLFPSVPAARLFAAVLFAVIAGALWGGIAGLIKDRYKISEAVTTILMNFCALFLHRLIVRSISGGSFFTNGSRFYNGIWLALAAIIVYLLIKINKNQKSALIMAIAGSFAGLAGAAVSLEMFYYGRVFLSFESVAAAVAGNANAIGIAITGIFIGILKSAQTLIQARQIPMEITAIIIGLIIAFSARKKENTEENNPANIALEGFMAIGALIAAISYAHIKSIFAALLFAAIAGAALSLLHALAFIKFNKDKIITGIGVNVFSYGLAFFICQYFFRMDRTPFFAPAFDNKASLLIWIPLVIMIAAWFVFYKRVTWTYIAEAGFGFLAGLAGACFVLTMNNQFTVSAINGKGYIAFAIAYLLFKFIKPLNRLS